MSIDAFSKKIDLLSTALREGNLINDKLQVIEKGCLWNLRCFGRKLFSCGRTDPFADVRASNVAQALIKEYDRAIPRNDTSREELKNKIVKEILTPLAEKTHERYFKIAQNGEFPILQVRAPIATPSVSSEHKQAVLKSINNLAYKLNITMTGHQVQSVCFAPLSIAAVLGMAMKAMPEQSKKRVLLALKLDLPEETVHKALNEIFQDMARATGDQGIISFANAIAVNPEHRVNPEYTRMIRQEYQGDVFPLNSADDVNRWVAQRTEGLIPELLDSNDIPRDTIAVLLNAMYFCAKWIDEFSTPFKAPFTFANSKTIDIQTIRNTGQYAFIRNEEFQMIEIPFRSPQGHRLSYIIFLPNDPKNLLWLEQQLTPEFIETCRTQARSQEVRVTMPMIEVNAKQEHLLGMLEELGIHLGDPLPGLAEKAMITKVIHQAKLKIDNKGAEGAAATAAVVERCCPMSHPPTDFDVGHNFHYIIMAGNAPIFQGNVRDKSALVR